MAKIIFLHGTSSSGKSTLAKAIQSQLTTPFWHFSSDQFIAANMLPKQVNDGGPFDWKFNRPRFFNGFHECIKALLDTNNDLILDHIIESQTWFQHLQNLLRKHDVFFVGVHCPLNILRQRELLRNDRHIGNRYVGEAEYHIQHVHSYCDYDFAIDSSSQPITLTCELIINAWQTRKNTKFFDGFAQSS